MPKIIKNVYCENLTFDKLLSAFERAKKNKGRKLEIYEFEFNLERNILDLLYELKSGNYKMGEYREFTVYEPKERIIKCLPFKDRVVHQWYVYEFLITYNVPKFIHHSYACIKDRGTHAAVKTLSKFNMQARNQWGSFYVLKMDIQKFFYSINPRILFDILRKTYGDEDFLKLSRELIFTGDKIGIPIGNYTSQYYANIYLNELDHYIKRELKVKYYVRFMDDFVMLVKSKNEAKRIFSLVEVFLKKKLQLNVNPKSKYFPSGGGIDFCGYRVFYTHILVRNRSKKNMRKRIYKWNKDFDAKGLNYNSLICSFNSWKSHISHASSYNLLKNYKKRIKVFNLMYTDK